MHPIWAAAEVVMMQGVAGFLLRSGGWEQQWVASAASLPDRPPPA